MKLLIACCGARGGLFTMDTEAQEVDLIFPSYALTGFRWYDGAWWAIDRCRINLHGPDLWLHGEVELDRMFPWADLHDLCGLDKYLFVATTGANCVEVWQVEHLRERTKGMQLQRLTRIGAICFDRIDGTDWRHVNGVCATEEGLYVSMFSLEPEFPPGTRWREVTNGGIVFCTWDQVNEALERRPIEWTPEPHLDPDPVRAEYQVMVSDIRHPHSLVIHDGYLYFCESLDQRVSRVPLAGGVKELVMKIHNGYARGLAVLDDAIYVGASSTEAHPHTLAGSSLRAATVYLFEGRGEPEHIIIPEAQEVYQISLMEV